MNRAHRSLPDPIPVSYYARPAGAAQTSRGPAWRRWATDLRGWPLWKRVLAVIGAAAAAVCVALTPWRPALGLLGALVLACVVLATDAWGLRGRVPLLRSTNRAHVTGGWGLISGLLLVSVILAAQAPGPPSPPAGAQASRPAPPRPPAAEPTPPPGLATTSPVAPGTPTPTPTATPRRTASPAPTTVTFLNAPLASRGGQTVTLLVRTSPGTACSIVVGYQPPPGLDPTTSSSTGSVSWTWRVSRQASAGTYPITVTCGGGAATTQIVLT